MTPKQKRFCEEYLIDLNGAQAAIRAGYKPRASNREASRLLSKVDIQQRIKSLMAERSERTSITADAVLDALARIAFADIRRLFKGGELLNPAELPDDIVAALAALEIDAKGNVKVRVNDRTKALELLGRHLGLFRDRVEATVTTASAVTIFLPDNGRDPETAQSETPMTSEAVGRG